MLAFAGHGEMRKPDFLRHRARLFVIFGNTPRIVRVRAKADFSAAKLEIAFQELSFGQKSFYAALIRRIDFQDFIV